MSDREAFVAAIAANPTDDLPRLVFADWLEEHRDPDRAEFIRTQTRWHHATDEGEKQRLNSRAAALCHDQWPRWFDTLLRALDPTADLRGWYQVYDAREAARVVRLTTMSRSATTPRVVESVSFCRGFVDRLTLHPAAWADGSLAEAFAHEPVHGLSCQNGLHSPVWRRFTDPALRRVERLHLTQQWAWAVSAPHSGAFLDDPHLAGVRRFGLDTEPERDGERPPLPVAWLEAFTRSPLAYRLTGLSLSRIDANGIPPLCRPGRLRLERLALGGELTADGVRRLGASELAHTVRELTLTAAGLDNTAVAALAGDDWRKLTRLELTENTLTAAALPTLAAAAFTPKLDVLDLSGNPLFDGEERDMVWLQELVEALDPDRLEHLDLSDTGLSHVPDFLAERFGDRVTV